MSQSHDPKKCAHSPCSCTVTEGKYCSQYCEDASKAMSSTIGCSCPHMGCGGKL